MPDTLVELEGCNGTWFTLAGAGKGELGAWLAEGDIDQFVEQPIDTIYNSHAFQIGADYGGERMPPREFTFTVELLATPTMSIGDVESEFRKALSTRKDARIWVEVEDSRRWITVRLRQHMRVIIERDPKRTNHVRIVCSAIAADPRYYEATQTYSWEATTDTSGGGTQNGVIHVPKLNPTPDPIWLQWVVQASTGVRWTIPDYSFGDDRYRRAAADASRRIVMPPLLAGEHLFIDADESAKHEQVVSNIDTQVYLRMNGVRFLYPVPEYTGAVDLNVSVSNAPAGVGIQVRCVRPWRSAWGLQ